MTGGVGTGKSSLVAHFSDAACRRGERVFYFAFEESSPQIIRNMNSIGLRLEKWINKGLLHIEASRPTLFGLETHLVNFYKAVDTHHPHVIIMDPINDFLSIGSSREIKALFLRMVDFLKSCQITLICTGLTSPSESAQETEVGVSSLADTWILLSNLQFSGEHRRQMYILKSRGMAHSNQVREYTMSHRGFQLHEKPAGVRGNLKGSPAH